MCECDPSHSPKKEVRVQNISSCSQSQEDFFMYLYLDLVVYSVCSENVAACVLTNAQTISSHLMEIITVFLFPWSDKIPRARRADRPPSERNLVTDKWRNIRDATDVRPLCANLDPHNEPSPKALSILDWGFTASLGCIKVSGLVFGTSRSLCSVTMFIIGYLLTS